MIIVQLISLLCFKPASEMTYIVSGGPLNSNLNYHYCVLKISELQWRHLVIFACSTTFVQRPIPEKSHAELAVNTCLDFITKQRRPLNSLELNPLDYYVWANVWGLHHRYRPKAQISPNSKKWCKWQSNSGYDTKSCKRALKLLDICVVANLLSVDTFNG